LALSVFLLVQCRFSFAESDRPKHGSVQFGAVKDTELNGSGNGNGNGNIEKGNQIGKGLPKTFADIVDMVVPSVVSVIPTKIDTVLFYRNPFYRFFGPPPERDPFEFYFEEPAPESGTDEEPQVERRERKQRGQGSGVIVSADGYVLTNYHVVSGADEIDVKLHDGRRFKVNVVGIDSLSDVAVLKIDENVKNLPVAYLGNSDQLRIGDWLIAVGNPFSLNWTVTSGIVSALGRSVTGTDRFEDFIQTDAAINPGNSGGALVNTNGEVVGINTMIYTRSGGYMGIGFAIPINMAIRVMKDLVYDGRVTRGWIGVSVQPLDHATRDALGLRDLEGGVLVSDVFEGHPAHMAGMKRGDVIVSVEGRGVNVPNDLRNLVAALKPDSVVVVMVVRNGRRHRLNVTIVERTNERILGSRPARTHERSERAKPEEQHVKIDILGISISNITDTDREEYDIPSETQGAIIRNLAASSPLFGELREGDVIRELKKSGASPRPVQSAEELRAALHGVDKGDGVLVMVERSGSTFYASFRID
ncbi:MAG: Do family serine endopeptidase, partial [Chitinivibrionales bacterium]|nr:Do family serine endopeptidase [Chitinivibrionales bacterium]MBD3357507.1 Do family serine endopeptidase [Chitinivibrionales bacterium]